MIFSLERTEKWVSKAPGKKMLLTNILEIFDLTSWFFILASMVLMSLMLIAVHKVQHYLGGENQDISLSIITPLAMLTAENISATAKTSRSLLLTRSFLLLLWSVMGSMIIFFFACNLRAMLLKPARDAPINMSKDLIEQGKTPIIVTTAYQYIIANSPNEWQKMTAKTALVLPNPLHIKSNLEKLVQADGTHAMTGNVYGIAWRMRDQENQIAIHFSQENLYSYYTGWIMGKKSPWKNVMNQYLGLFKQVNYI